MNFYPYGTPAYNSQQAWIAFDRRAQITALTQQSAKAPPMPDNACEFACCELSRCCATECQKTQETLRNSTKEQCNIRCAGVVAGIFQIIGIVLMGTASNNPNNTITNPTQFGIGTAFLIVGTIIECALCAIGCHRCCNNTPPLASQGH